MRLGLHFNFQLMVPWKGTFHSGVWNNDDFLGLAKHSSTWGRIKELQLGRTPLFIQSLILHVEKQHKGQQRQNTAPKSCPWMQPVFFPSSQHCDFILHHLAVSPHQNVQSNSSSHLSFLRGCTSHPKGSHSLPHSHEAPMVLRCRQGHAGHTSVAWAISQREGSNFLSSSSSLAKPIEFALFY